MKLIRCHIENFGVLSGCDYEFQDGLNVLLAPNGSGKSTLAAFLKAMFYGLPAKGPRSATENERKRYEPWQGGTYGGFLEFDYRGTAFRVTRSFGATAARDCCEIRNLDEHRSSDRFTGGSLGELLFQLDADSFSRSVFLSGGDPSVSVTSTIRAKLSNLVEDTNDLNNYDTAIERLRQKRAAYQPYRGASGSIPRAADALEQARGQLYDARELRPRLEELEAEIRAKERSLTEKNGAVRVLRQKISEASVLETRQSQRKQLAALRQEAAGFQDRLNELDQRYPKGFPARDELERARSAAAARAQAVQDHDSAAVSAQDLALYEAERAAFPDPEQVRQDLDACQSDCVELEALSAKLTAQMLPAELDRLAELAARFPEDPPAEAALTELEALADEQAELARRLDGLSLSADEQSKFRALERCFAAGEPGMEQISDCEKRQQEIAALRERKRGLALSEDEQAEDRRLSRVFASGVPGADEIPEKQQAARRIAELTGKKNTRAALPEARPTEGGRARMPKLLGLISALLVLGGTLCFILAAQVPGILLLVAGMAGALLSLALHFRSAAARPVVLGSAITEAENQELYDLRHGLADFLLRFYPDAADPDKQLTQLFSDREKFLALREKKARFEREREAAEQEIREKEQRNLALFERFYPDQPYTDDFTNDLMLKYHNFLGLRTRVQALRDERARLNAELDRRREALRAALGRDCPEADEDLRAAVQRLCAEAREYGQLRTKRELMLQSSGEAAARRDALRAQIEGLLSGYGALTPGLSPTDCLSALRKRLERYQEASFRVLAYQAARKAALDRKAAAEAALDDFFRRCGLPASAEPKALQAIDDDLRLRETLTARLAETGDKLGAFLREYPEAADPAPTEADRPAPDLDALQLAEKRTQEEAEQIQTELRDLRQGFDSLCRSVEEIPGLEDRIARLEAGLEHDREAVRLLDKTMALMERAKDQLATRYVGQLEQGFRRYAERLFDGKLGEAMVDQDLRLSIGAQGRQRELGFFSAGTVESVVLCMRLALVDALFTQEQPFLLLDDPFVSLDDERAARSLEMLRTLAQDRQVIYLVCSSSRC